MLESKARHEAQKKGAAIIRQRALERAEWIVAAVDQGASPAWLAAELEVSILSVRTIVSRARRRLRDAA